MRKEIDLRTNKDEFGGGSGGPIYAINGFDIRTGYVYNKIKKVNENYIKIYIEKFGFEIIGGNKEYKEIMNLVKDKTDYDLKNQYKKYETIDWESIFISLIKKWIVIDNNIVDLMKMISEMNFQKGIQYNKNKIKTWLVDGLNHVDFNLHDL